MDHYRHLTVIAVIAICGLIFAGERMQETSLHARWGATPADLSAAFEHLRSGHLSAEDVRKFSTLVSHQFLHADPEHIVYNIMFLWIFGVLVSNLLGQWRTLLIYLLCEIVGGITHGIMVHDALPLIGASGAISGLEGLYVGMALRWQLPNANVWPLAYPVPPMQLVGLAVIAFFGDLILFRLHRDNIAHGAHLGGVLCGLLMAGLITTVYPTLNNLRQRAR